MNNKNIAWAIYSTFQLKIIVTHCIVIKNQADEHSKIYIQCYYCFHGVIFLFKTPQYVSFVDKQETCNVAIRLTLLRNGCNAAKQVTFYVEKPKTLVPSCTRVKTRMFFFVKSLKLWTLSLNFVFVETKTNMSPPAPLPLSLFIFSTCSPFSFQNYLIHRYISWQKRMFTGYTFHRLRWEYTEDPYLNQISTFRF